MVEVLVTVVVISFGLLGLAGLQATSIRNNHGSHLRFLVTQQAYDMTDRIRANLAGVKAGHYDSVSGIPDKNDCISATTGTGCTPAQLASQDVRQWNNTNKELLPSGRGIVCRDSSPDDGEPTATACSGGTAPLVIKIWWDDDKTGSTSLKRYTATFQP